MLLTKSQVAHRIQTQRLVERSKSALETASSNLPVLPDQPNIVQKAIALVKKHLTTGIVITTTALTLGCGEPQTAEDKWRSIAWKTDPVCRERINDATIEFQLLRDNAWQHGHLTGKITVDQFYAIKESLLVDLRRKQDLIYHDSITQLRKE